MITSGFIDTHIHHQTSNRSRPMSAATDWLENYTFPEEKRFKTEGLMHTQSGEAILDEPGKQRHHHSHSAPCTKSRLTYSWKKQRSATYVWLQVRFNGSQRARSPSPTRQNPATLTPKNWLRNKYNRSQVLFLRGDASFCFSTSTPEHRSPSETLKSTPMCAYAHHLSENEKEIEWQKNCSQSVIAIWMCMTTMVYCTNALYSPSAAFTSSDCEAPGGYRIRHRFRPTSSNLFLGLGLFRLYRMVTYFKLCWYGYRCRCRRTSFSILQTMSEAYKIMHAAITCYSCTQPTTVPGNIRWRTFTAFRRQDW